MGLQARPTAGQLGGVRGGGLQRERRLRVEGRDGVGVDHLGHDPVVLELAPATGRVPVAAPVGALQVVIGDLVGGGPRVELVAIARLEVGAVLLELPAGVAIGRDHRVAVAHRPSQDLCNGVIGLPPLIPAVNGPELRARIHDRWKDLF